MSIVPGTKSIKQPNLSILVNHFKIFLQNGTTIFEFLKHLFENSPVIGGKLVHIVDIDPFGKLVKVHSDLVQFILHSLYFVGSFFIKGDHFVIGIKNMGPDKITDAWILSISGMTFYPDFLFHGNTEVKWFISFFVIR